MSRLHKSLWFFLIAMALFSAGRLALYLLYRDEFAALEAVNLFKAFANGTRFDGAVIARFFFIPLLLMNLPLRLFDKRWWFDPFAWLLYLVTVVLVGVVIGDVLYYDYVKRHLAYELILLKDDMGFLLDFVRAGYIWLIGLYGLFAAALFWLWRRILVRPLRPARWSALQYVAMFFLVAIIGRGGVTGKVIEIIDAYGTGDSAYGNLSLNGAFTTVVFALNLNQANHHFFKQDEAVAILARHRKVSDPAYPMLNHYDVQPTGHNVVFVLLESWNFEHVDSFSGKHYGATPNFDALARDGLRFSNFYAAGQRSIEGIQATLTGVPALKGLPRLDAGIGISNISRLGTTAKKHGYSTLFVQSSARDSFKISGIAAATGFEQFYGKEDIPLLLNYPDPDLATFGWDYDTLQFFKNKIDSLKPPFLAYAFTGTTHEPYPDLEKFHLRKPDPVSEGGFINALAYADWSLGQFMQAARQQSWFDNTIFIFTADHANHLQKGGYLRRFHTPFLIYAPKILGSGERGAVGSQLDVLPTIFDLLGFNDQFAALGESLIRKESGSAFTTMGSTSIGLITDRAYLVHSLKNRLEAVSIAGKQGDDYFDEIERYLLAQDQLSYELLRDNHWAK